MAGFRRDESLHPTEGARFLFELDSESPGHREAVYRAAIYTPAQRFDYRADLKLDGDYQVTAQGASADEELEDKLEVMARLIARGADRRRTDGMAPWPQRVLRWRGPGRG